MSSQLSPPHRPPSRASTQTHVSGPSSEERAALARATYPTRRLEIKEDKYGLVEIIGEGTYGEVRSTADHLVLPHLLRWSFACLNHIVLRSASGQLCFCKYRAYSVEIACGVGKLCTNLRRRARPAKRLRLASSATSLPVDIFRRSSSAPIPVLGSRFLGTARGLRRPWAVGRRHMRTHWARYFSATNVGSCG